MGRRNRGGYGIDPHRLAAMLADDVARAAQRRHEGLSRGARNMVAAAKANREARQEANFLELSEKRRAGWSSGQRRKPAGPLAGWKVLAAAMAPGAWYAERDLVALAKVSRGSVTAWLHQRMEPAGLVERAVNPSWDAMRPGRRQAEPRYLFRLTGEGVEAAEEWGRYLGAARGDLPSTGLLDGLAGML